MYVKYQQQQKYVLNWTYGLFGHNFRVVTTFYLTVSGIIVFKMDILTFRYYIVASLFKRYLNAKGIIPKSLKSIGQF